MKRQTRKRLNAGFSLVEMTVSMSIGIMFLGSMLALWHFSSKMWAVENIRGRLRLDVERTMEKIKNDIRLSDGNSIVFYPADASTYTGISFPAASRDANGFYSFSDGAIDWDKTIIYHIYDNAETAQFELRKTVIDSFDASPVNRQTALNSVVATGGQAGAVTSRLVKADDVALEMTPQNPTFDGYAESATISENTNFGSVRLTPGTHTIRFQVTGKNAASSGYAMGIDALYLTPSGGNPVEMEALLPVTASSADGAFKENMLPTGSLWGGNHHLSYLSNAVGDYFTVTLNYDLWLESNFALFSRTNVTLDSPDPALIVENRESQSNTPAWQADAQAGASASGAGNAAGTSVRTVISADQIQRSGNMIRVQFMASQAADVTINAAYFGPRNGATANFTGTPVQLYFGNSPMQTGESEGTGAVGTAGSTGVTVTADHFVWSNWFEYPISESGSVDYLVSSEISYAAGNTALWTSTDTAAILSYSVTGAQAGNTTAWASLPGYAADYRIYGVSQVASWIKTGTGVSPVYDTKKSAPAFNQISWAATLPAGSSVGVKVRSSADPNMVGATDWASLSAFTTSGASLAGIAQLRYVQYRVELTAASPFTVMPSVDNIQIDWPGSTTLVELSGYFTKRPNYGTFKILVDDNNTVKALETKVTAVKEFRGTDYSFSQKAEVRSRNTGK